MQHPDGRWDDLRIGRKKRSILRLIHTGDLHCAGTVNPKKTGASREPAWRTHTEQHDDHSMETRYRVWGHRLGSLISLMAIALLKLVWAPDRSDTRRWWLSRGVEEVSKRGAGVRMISISKRIGEERKIGRQKNCNCCRNFLCSIRKHLA